MVYGHWHCLVSTFFLPPPPHSTSFPSLTLLSSSPPPPPPTVCETEIRRSLWFDKWNIRYTWQSSNNSSIITSSLKFCLWARNRCVDYSGAYCPIRVFDQVQELEQTKCKTLWVIVIGCIVKPAHGISASRLIPGHSPQLELGLGRFPNRPLSAGPLLMARQGIACPLPPPRPPPTPHTPSLWLQPSRTWWT